MSNQSIQVEYHHGLESLEKTLSKVRRSGDFFVEGSVEVPMPKLEVDGVGVISFPVPDTQVRQLIAQAERAPYGRGEETIVDTAVRKVWQLPPAKVRLGGKSWPGSLQGIVDQVLHDEASLIGLTTLRDYDEYTFTHSVNVCTFAVALGRKLGLTKLQLYDVGMAALFHDVGKSRVPLEVLNKEGGLSEEEWRIMQAHPWLGVLTLFGLRGYGEIPYRGMVVAYEHHMKIDLTGYPKNSRPRRPTLFSRIVATADGFDAATSKRSVRD